MHKRYIYLDNEEHINLKATKQKFFGISLEINSEKLLLMNF